MPRPFPQTTQPKGGPGRNAIKPAERRLLVWGACVLLVGGVANVYAQQSFGPPAAIASLGYGALMALSMLAWVRWLNKQASTAQDAQREHNLLRCMLESWDGYAIIATDPEGHITHVNGGAEHMLGYSARTLIGLDSLSRLHDPQELRNRAAMAGATDLLAMVRPAPGSNSCLEQEWTYVCRNGSRLPVALSVIRVHDGLGHTQGFVSIARDLTQDKTHQRDRDGYLQVGQELLCIAGANSILHAVNPAFYPVLGYTPADLIGKRSLDFVHPDDLTTTQTTLVRIIGGLAVRRLENRWRAKDGSWRWIAWDTTAANELGLCYCSGLDISEEKKRGEERLRRLQFEQQLIGIVSHDLRGPIAAITLSAEHLLRRLSAATDPDTRHVQRIANCANRAERLVHDLLDFTQARLGDGLRISCHKMDLVASARSCIDDVRVLYPACNIILKSPAHVEVWADSDRIGQIFTNLLTNAARYGQMGSPIDLAVDRTRDAFFIQVHNSGDPILQNALPKIFEPLQRGDIRQDGTGDASTHRNVGLGLYIVQEIARAHGGSVQVTSSAQDGTAFRVDMPTKANLPGAHI